MNVAALSPQQLRSLVEDKWQRDQKLLRSACMSPRPGGTPSEVEFDFGKASVVRADTVFQVREALLDRRAQNRRIILLTKLQHGDLGHDVVARLARCRLFPIDHWASLCALFKAKELDRSICDQAIAQALLENAPADGYPPVSAGSWTPERCGGPSAGMFSRWVRANRIWLPCFSGQPQNQDRPVT